MRVRVYVTFHASYKLATRFGTAPSASCDEGHLGDEALKSLTEHRVHIRAFVLVNWKNYSTSFNRIT